MNLELRKVTLFEYDNYLKYIKIWFTLESGPLWFNVNEFIVTLINLIIKINSDANT